MPLNDRKSDILLIMFKTVVKSEADMLSVLEKMKGEFKFWSISFESDIDLYFLIKKHPITGINLIGNGDRQANPHFFPELTPCLNFSDLSFDFPVSFLECRFTTSIAFSNVTFKEGLDMRYSDFLERVEFRGVSAAGKSKLVFNCSSDVVILDSDFDLEQRHLPNMEITGMLHIERTFLSSGINLNKAAVGGQLNLINNKITGNLDLSASKLSALNIICRHPLGDNLVIDALNLNEVECSGQVQILKISISSDFKAQGAIFMDNIFFTGVEFLQKAFLTHCNFVKSIFFEDVMVQKMLSFSSSIFHNGLNLTRCNLTTADLYFVGAKVHSDIWIGVVPEQKPTSFIGTLNFRGAYISPESVIRIHGLNAKNKRAGTLVFSNALIKGFLDLKDVFFQNITFDSTIVLGNIQDNNTLFLSVQDRSTARLLKHESKRVNNNISAVAYSKLEMNLHRKGLGVKDFTDLMILWLNKVSNNYGTNWLLGVVFTFFGGLLFYSLFEICKIDFAFFWEDGYSCIYFTNKFWSGFIDYFWLPAGFKELTEAGKLAGGGFGATWFIIGKIIIAYGVYQTVAAFRKYI